ncbi:MULTISPECIES: helix-turn-helix domain-containing protein [Dermacoccus]|uniref:helix-turn-helix domain-containing protein n=1 Tax=Dermacoccus TaxID=57495 RepID=UPI00093EA5AA|nr:MULTISPECIES: helix-turn-helix transcriptional regulator [Dermacoccus]MBO1757914.1 helix-turn-helix transcriptional regulator [Dermacoccus sp. NHGro5]
MDFLDDIFGPETDEDRLAERNLVHEEEWLSRLVELRKGKNLSQGDVGERMGISQSGVARIEAGNRDLHLSSLRRYAIAVGAEVRHVVNPARPTLTVDIEPEDVAPVVGVPRARRDARTMIFAVGG